MRYQRGLIEWSLTHEQDDWHDIPPVKTAWGTDVEAGWWGVTVRAEEGRVSVQVRGRLNKVNFNGLKQFLQLTEECLLTSDRNIQINPLI